MNIADYIVRECLKIRAEMLGQDMPVASSAPASGSREERLAPRKSPLVAAAEKLAAEMRGAAGR